MKVYISADIEGITGLAHWDETLEGKVGYPAFARQMTLEVKAACEALIEFGVKDIWVQDAHESGRNIAAEDLPEEVKLVRGWSDNPLCMLQAFDESFDAVVLIGFHAPSGSSGSPISHTFSTKTASLEINGILASEYLVAAYTAAYYGVPVLFISGDKAICEQAKRINPNIKVLAVKEGVSNSVASIHPNLAVKQTKLGIKEALSGGLDAYKIKLPEQFHVEITYSHHSRAYKLSYYPGMKKLNDYTLSYDTGDFYEVLRMLLFAGY